MATEREDMIIDTSPDWETYIRMQRHFDREDIKNYFDECNPYENGATIQEQFGISDEEAYALVPEIARVYREYLDNDDTWDALRTYAVWDVIDKYKAEKGNRK